jgi:phosphonoacetaldehyde hydrolase
VILDWAGTTMDFGCIAPAVAFIEVFEQRGVPITLDEARAPMGAHKRDHIVAITQIDSVRRRWEQAHGRGPVEDDIESMYRAFIPLQVSRLAGYSKMIPGAVETVDELRRRGIRIGTTTGYTSEMMEVNAAEARQQGYEPDCTVCASDVPRGRPWPYMCYRNAVELGVMSLENCVKVDDTVPGIDEGLNASMWTVGLAVSGNEVGLSLADWNALSDDEQAPLRERAHLRLRQSGAHYVVDTIADLLPCIDEIARRISLGETP